MTLGTEGVRINGYVRYWTITFFVGSLIALGLSMAEIASTTVLSMTVILVATYCTVHQFATKERRAPTKQEQKSMFWSLFQLYGFYTLALIGISIAVVDSLLPADAKTIVYGSMIGIGAAIFLFECGIMWYLLGNKSIPKAALRRLEALSN